MVEGIIPYARVKFENIFEGFCSPTRAQWRVQLVGLHFGTCGKLTFKSRNPNCEHMNLICFEGALITVNVLIFSCSLDLTRLNHCHWSKTVPHSSSNLFLPQFGGAKSARMRHAQGKANVAWLLAMNGTNWKRCFSFSLLRSNGADLCDPADLKFPSSNGGLHNNSGSSRIKVSAERKGDSKFTVLI